MISLSSFKILRVIKNWPRFILDRLGLIRDERHIYRLRNGLSLQLRPHTADLDVLSEIWIYNHYTPPGFSIGARDIVVDIGAQAGVFTVLSAHAASRGKVYSFEPVPVNFDLLKENVIRNGLKNVNAMNKAVSQKDGVAFLNLSEVNTGGHSLYALPDTSSKKIKVQTVSFSSFLKKLSRIDYLKLDCEGSEYDILFPLKKASLRKIRCIVAECHYINTKKTSKTLAKFLHDNGFDVQLEDMMLYAKNEDRS